MTRVSRLLVLAIVFLGLTAPLVLAHTGHVLEDTYINLSSPNQTNGHKKDLVVRNVGGERQGFLQFDLSTLPSGATVDQAILRVFINKVQNEGALNLPLVEAAWDEETLNANTVVPVVFLPFASRIITQEDESHYVAVDMTAQVQAWLNGTPNYGVALLPDPIDDLKVEIDSKETTNTSHSAEIEVVLVGGGTPGPQGEPGPPGPQGVTGADGANGASGPQGDPGPQGPAGADGAPGPQGPIGLPGAQGPAGANGTPGADGSKWFTGTGVPNPVDGVTGDFYVDEASGDYYEKTDGTMWTLAGNLQGPQGEEGPVGPQGVAGVDGTDGAPGPQGVAGVDGANGAPGPQGPQGDPGTSRPSWFHTASFNAGTKLSFGGVSNWI